MSRKGASNVLWIAVISVVMLAAAVFLLQIGTNALGNAGDQTGQSTTRAEVQQACNQLAQRADNQVCNQYVDEGSSGSCSGMQDQYAEGKKRGYQVGCQWAGTSEIEDAIVQTSEGEFHCVEEGYLSNTNCPAS